MASVLLSPAELRSRQLPLPGLAKDPPGEHRDYRTPEVDCRVVEAPGGRDWRLVHLVAPPSPQPLRSSVQGLSRRGIGLLVACPLKPGTVLTIQLRHGQTGGSDTLTARVRHAVPQSPHHWYVVCGLSRTLTSAEMIALIHGELMNESA